MAAFEPEPELVGFVIGAVVAAGRGVGPAGDTVVHLIGWVSGRVPPFHSGERPVGFVLSVVLVDEPFHLASVLEILFSTINDFLDDGRGDDHPTGRTRVENRLFAVLHRALGITIVRVPPEVILAV